MHYFTFYCTFKIDSFQVNSGCVIYPTMCNTELSPILASVAWRSSHSGRRKRRAAKVEKSGAAKKVAAEGMERGKRGKERQPPTTLLTGEMFERNYSL